MKAKKKSNRQKRKVIIMKQRCNIQNIKSGYIIKQIFDSIQKRKTLDILKTNKKVKQRAFININDYKKYCEEFSTIEVEIIPNDKFFNKFKKK